MSVRFAGLDGVSMEAAKLVPVIEEAEHEVSWFAGELGDGFIPGVEDPRVHFDSEQNLALEARAFGAEEPDPSVWGEIRWRASSLKPAIKSYLEGIDVAYVHNSLSIPMQLPFAVAMTEAFEETRVRVVGHHHDFGWEKPRFAHCTVPEVLDQYFPPNLGNMSHAVINSLAQRELAERTGIEATLLPNILDFERGPTRPVDGATYRAAAGIDADATLLLQPTRIIERKGIESTIQLAAALGPQAVVAFSHAADRDAEYWRKLVELADTLGVQLVYSPTAPEASTEPPWLGDAFEAADLVCIPSIQEGFGNALVETLFFKRPLFVNRYDVYVADLAPMGVQAIEMDGAVTAEVVDHVQGLLDSPESSAQMAEANYAVGLEHMSHRIMRERLLPLLEGRG